MLIDMNPLIEWQKARQEARTRWHPWFAWYPVRIDDTNTFAFLRTIWRRQAHVYATREYLAKRPLEVSDLASGDFVYWTAPDGKKYPAEVIGEREMGRRVRVGLLDNGTEMNVSPTTLTKIDMWATEVNRLQRISVASGLLPNTAEPFRQSIIEDAVNQQLRDDLHDGQPVQAFGLDGWYLLKMLNEDETEMRLCRKPWLSQSRHDTWPQPDDYEPKIGTIEVTIDKLMESNTGKEPNDAA